MRSATNGVTGARSCAHAHQHVVERPVRACLLVVISPFQNYRRRRRTYQFDRSSWTKSSTARGPGGAGSASSAARTSPIVVCRRERSHGSSPAASRGAAASGRQHRGRSMFAYVTKSDATFQSVEEPALDLARPAS